MSLAKTKQQVFDCNLELVRRGLVIYTWGNVSARDADTGFIVIKPRGVLYELLEADDMSVVDVDGTQVGEGLLPSVDLDIHLELYRRFPVVGGVAHTHSTWATAWAQAEKSIPVMGTTHGDHFYGDIPCARQLTEEEVEHDYERNLGRILVESVGSANPLAIPAILAAAHGPFAWGETPEAAVEHSVILEELAKMAKLTADIAGAFPRLPRHMLDKHYLRKYGPDAYFYQKKEGGK